MNRLKNYVLMAAGFAVLAMTVGAFTAGHAIAQAVRAALVSNVDDPGRIPYQKIVYDNVCASSVCLMYFPPVPAGKHLVITNVSGRLNTNVPGGSLITPELLAAGVITVYFPTLFQGTYAGVNTFIFNQQTQVTYDAGEAPLFSIYMGAFGTSYSSAVLTGYLLDCSTAPCAAIAP
jgi:hypothetical protein